METPGRRLTLLDCVGVGINGIVGSGIFLLPAVWAGMAGPLSILALIGCGLVCVLVGLCFGEMAGIAGNRSGGPYRYATLAFGDTVGFAVGWIAVVSGFLGYAAVARGLSERALSLAGIDGGANPGLVAAAAVSFIAFLGLLNVIGLKLGAGVSDVLSVAKLLPLGLFVVTGLPHVSAANLTPFESPTGAGLYQAVWLSLFACSGFEYVSVPAADTDAPQRNVPRAVIFSVLGATVLYGLIQLAAVGGFPGLTDPANAGAPLEAAAAHFAGATGRWAIAVGAVVSMAGFCSGSALIGPRYLASVASDRNLPAFLAVLHPTRGTPWVSIGVTSVIAALLSATLGFTVLVDFSSLAIVGQFLPTCLAVIVLRRRRPDLPRSYRVPLGPMIPAFAILVVGGLLVANTSLGELGTAAGVLAAGLLIRAAGRAVDRPAPGPSSTA